MKLKTKIWWKDFHGTKEFREMQEALARFNLHLHVEYDENKVATDVHVCRVTKEY